MNDDTLTPEETQHLEAMQVETDPEPSAEPVTAEPVSAEPQAPEGATPEFKSARALEKPPEGFVPHQAMHAERMKRQELERRLEQLESQQTPADEPPKYVDPLEDPEGYRKYDEYHRNKVMETVQRQQQTVQQQQVMQQRASTAAAAEAEFVKTTPDYHQAAQFIHQARINQLQSMGYGPGEIQRQMMIDANNLFDAGQQSGINPARLLYMQAQEAGYVNSTGQTQAPTTAAAQLEATANAQAQTRGMGTGGGAGQTGKLTVAQMAEMSEAEIAKLSPEQVEAAFTG